MNDLLKTIAELSRYYIVGCLLMLFFTVTRSDISLSNIKKDIETMQGLNRQALEEVKKPAFKKLKEESSVYLKLKTSFEDFKRLVEKEQLTGRATFYGENAGEPAPKFVLFDPIEDYPNVSEPEVKVLDVMRYIQKPNVEPSIFTYNYDTLKGKIEDFICHTQAAHKPQPIRWYTIVTQTTLPTKDAVQGKVGSGHYAHTCELEFWQNPGSGKAKDDKKVDSLPITLQVKSLPVGLPALLEYEQVMRREFKEKLVLLEKARQRDVEAYSKIYAKPISEELSSYLVEVGNGGPDIEFLGIKVNVKFFRLIGPVFIILIGIYFISHLMSLYSAVRRVKKGMIANLKLEEVRHQLRVFPLIITETHWFFTLFSVGAYVLLPCFVIIYLYKRAYCQEHGWQVFNCMKANVSTYAEQTAWYVFFLTCVFGIGLGTVVVSYKINQILKEDTEAKSIAA